MRTLAKQCMEFRDFTRGSAVKKTPGEQETLETQVQSLGQEDSLQEEMASSSCLGNPMDRGAGGLQSMGLQRVRHN